MNQDTAATSEQKEGLKQHQIYPRYIPCIDCGGMGFNWRQRQQLERDSCSTCQGRGFLFSLT